MKPSLLAAHTGEFRSPFEQSRSKQIASIYRYIDENIEKHVSRLKRFIRIPSVVGDRIDSMLECAEFVRGTLERIGCQETKLLETNHSWRKQSPPIVYGRYEAYKRNTLLVYSAYDVKQVMDEQWSLTSDPFDPKVISLEPFRRVIVGRGAHNSKGPLSAFFNSVEGIHYCGFDLPVNVVFLIEGEEELGSAHLGRTIRKYMNLFSDCDACLIPSGSQDLDGEAKLQLGNKGLVEFELECSSKLWGRGPKHEVHSSLASIVDSPIWRLIHALSSMTDPKKPDHIVIEGFYDAVAPPSDHDLHLLKKLNRKVDQDVLKKQNEIYHFKNTLRGFDLLRRFLFSTTLNIQGISGGYRGQYFKTVIPDRAVAKLESRLVPNQTPAEILSKVRHHLDSLGYYDIKMMEHRQSAGSNYPSKTDPKSGLVRSILHAYSELGYDPQVWPLSPRSMPGSLFTKNPLHIPLAIAGLGYGARAHGPDEYFVLEGNRKVDSLAGAEKFFVNCLYAMGMQNNLR